ncbi:MAG: helix-turn-helix domain-containing protein [Actinomycetales bacterium]
MTATLERLIEPQTRIDSARGRTGRYVDFPNATTYAVASSPPTTGALLASRTGYRLATDGSTQNFALSLRGIQENSGMSWGEIAQALGVSRRTVHNWLTSTRVNGQNALRIGGLYRAVTQELANVPRGDAREHLLAPSPHGSRWAAITRNIRESYPRQARPAGGFAILRSTDPNSDLTPITGGLDEAVEVIDGDDG